MKQKMMMAVVAIGLVGSQLTGWGAEDPKVKTEADIKAISTQLTSDDPQKVQEAIKAIQQSMTKDPRTGVQTLATRWNMPLPPGTGHYQICQVTDPVAGTFTILDDATTTTYLLENQTVGTTLQLKVRGTNDGGDGKFSPTVPVTVT